MLESNQKFIQKIRVHILKKRCSSCSLQLFFKQFFGAKRQCLIIAFLLKL